MTNPFLFKSNVILSKIVYGQPNQPRLHRTLQVYISTLIVISFGTHF